MAEQVLITGVITITQGSGEKAELKLRVYIELQKRKKNPMNIRRDWRSQFFIPLLRSLWRNAPEM